MLTVLFAVDNGYYLWFYDLFCSHYGFLLTVFFVPSNVLFVHSMALFCSLYGSFLFTLWLFFVHSIARTLQCTFCSLYGSFLYHPMYFLFTIWLFLVQAMIIFGLLLVFIINYFARLFVFFCVFIRSEQMHEEQGNRSTRENR